MSSSLVSQKANEKGLKQALYYLFFLSVAGFILFVNQKMPLVGEDYTLQSHKYNAPPQSLFEQLKVLAHQIYNSAVMWSPRIGEALSTATSPFPNGVFDVINTILFLWLVIVLFSLAFGRFPKPDKYADLFTIFSIVFLIICFFPLLGQVFFWKAGVTNHLWGVTLLMSFILPFRLNYSKKIELKNFPGGILFTIFGVIAGLTIENASGVALAFLLLYYLYSYFRNSIDRKFIFPLLANMIGVSLLLFSPGTTFRRNYYSQFGYDGDFQGIALFVNRFERVHHDLIKITWPLLVILLICLIIFGMQNKREIKLIAIKDNRTLISLVTLLIMAYSSVFVMITISYQSDQRRGFTFFWLILISLIAYLMTEIIMKIPKKTNLIIVSVLSTILIAQMVNLGRVYTSFNHETKVRLEIIHSALDTGKKRVVLPAITTPDSRIIETREILEDLGVRYAHYFGLESVEIQR